MFDPIIKRMLDKADVGKRLEQAMARAKCTHTELAELTGVTLQAVTGWIKTGRIARKHYAAITKRLNTTVGYLLTGNDEWPAMAVAEAPPPFNAKSKADQNSSAHTFSSAAIEAARLIDKCPAEYHARLVHTLRAEVDFILVDDAAKKKLAKEHKGEVHGTRPVSRGHRVTRKPTTTDA